MVCRPKSFTIGRIPDAGFDRVPAREQPDDAVGPEVASAAGDRHRARRDGRHVRAAR